tara:strand:+ start:253 stop:774 length:522 start_codon:yes stop_codon:yes gene_type:complete
MFTALIIGFTVFFLGLITFAIWSVKSKKNWLKIIGFILLTGISFFSYKVYQAFFPPEEFYKEEWTENIYLQFPKSAKFKFKEATYPDQHGDYTSTAVIQLDKLEYQKLKKQITTGLSFKNDSVYKGQKGLIAQYLPKEYYDKTNNIWFFSSISFFKIGLLETQNLIIFQHHNQ